MVERSTNSQPAFLHYCAEINKGHWRTTEETQELRRSNQIQATVREGRIARTRFEDAGRDLQRSTEGVGSEGSG